MPAQYDRGVMQRGAAASVVLHAGILAAMLLVFPHPVPPAPPPEDTVAVEFEGHSDHAQKGETPAKIAAAADAEDEAHDNPAKVAPTKAPLETAPPPPPPPPPPPQVEKVQTPPVKEPPPEPPKPSEAITPVKPPPPPPPVKQKPPEKPKTVPKSATAQPNEVKKPVVDTHALENQLDDLLADQKQVKPPTHRYNPERGGKKGGGGAKSGFLTGELSDGQRKQIGDDVRRCYSEDSMAKDYATYSAVMTVTIDAQGVVRDVKLSDADQGRANADPAFQAFAERAERAVLDPECSRLAIPPDLLGKPSQLLQFRFRP